MIKTVRCWECNKEIDVSVEEYYNPYNLKTYDKDWKNRKNLHKREYCNECRKAHEKDLRSCREEYARLNATLMVERAIRIMERQNIDMYEYKDAIDAVTQSFKENLERFRSAEEIVATIILIQQSIMVKNNFKIGRYTADIYIQPLTCIVEIDGYMHERASVKEKDGNKDIYIRNLLGREWEVIRIPTKYVHAKAENILSAIIELKAKMMEAREENAGLLPYNFSKTMDAVYDKILKG